MSVIGVAVAVAVDYRGSCKSLTCCPSSSKAVAGEGFLRVTNFTTELDFSKHFQMIPAYIHLSHNYGNPRGTTVWYR